MLTIEHIQALMPVLDAGLRAVGIQAFRDGNGAKLQAALDALQVVADAGGAKDEDPSGHDSEEAA
jgi:hypothetical protein